MRHFFSKHVLTLFAAVYFLTCSAPAAEFSELMRYLPDGANTLISLNVEKAYASAYGKKEGWDQEKGQATGAAPLKLPPDAKRIVIATQMDFEYMRPNWEVAVFELGIDPSMDFIAGHTKGTIDTLAGLEAVETQKDNVIVKFAPNIYGVMKPARRQRASRWVADATKRDSDALSPYLRNAANYPDRAGTEIVMALDLQSVLREKDLRHALAGSAVLRKHKADVDAVAEALASVQGVTLGIRVSDRVYGKLKVDLAKGAAPLADIVKPLLLEILGEAGASIDEMDNWKPDVSANRISLEGTLTSSGLLRIFSFVQHDSEDVDDKSEKTGVDKSDDPTTDKETVPYATKQYYDSVNRYLHDLKREKGATSFGQIGLWLQKYSRRIDKLPILNVDKDMVAYGAWTAEQLRNATESIQGVGIRSGARSAQVYNTNSGRASYSTGVAPVARYGNRGGYRLYGSGYGTAEWDTRNVQAERRAIRAEEKAKGSTEARSIVKEIENERSAIRRKMTERYKIEF